jgi:hypothetical protein
MKVALTAISMVAAITLLGVQKSPVAAGIDDALNEDRIVLVFRFQGDPAAISDDLAML